MPLHLNTIIKRHWCCYLQNLGAVVAIKCTAICCFFILGSLVVTAQRQDINLNANWQYIVTDKLNVTTFKDVVNAQNITVPHNADAYNGYTRTLHGNKHGNLLCHKKFRINKVQNDKQYFLFFEGVGSYATVYVNGKYAGNHAGGRTSFTLNITAFIKTKNAGNELIVNVGHPANIQDLPWVCGGCSDDRGFSEGSQPMGIFRPVHLIITNNVRIEPFGIHAWADIKNNAAALSINTTLKNYGDKKRSVKIVHQLVDANGKIVTEITIPQLINVKDSITVLKNHIVINDPVLWTTTHPYLYKIISYLKENNKLVDKTVTDFGFRTINFKTATHQFLLNDQPVFINGIAEYEHLLGQSHAFSDKEIIARLKWINAAGFNAFRDAHQPHNLLYGQLFNQQGVLWWTQFSAHVWYDTKAFKDNFKKLLREWVIERRNDPSVILWGLQNESKLPKLFAEECTSLIRSLDPTASAQRLVTTCNGGEGTDWDVPQNWTGTYGGDPSTYGNDLKKQILVGEYGAWRTLDLHTEGGFVQNGILSEDRMTQLMEQKIKLAESVKDSIAGHFFWLFNSHDNPGRVQGGEGARELDRIGPVNYKGLLTSWEEPTDAFYMFRSNYAPKQKDPMIYILSHTWTNRWLKPGVKDSLTVYSNCDEVELFNDIENVSLGKQKRNGIGTHFQWDKVNIQFNVLYAVGYINGIAVVKDTIVLNHLPASPNYQHLFTTSKSITKPQSGYNYIYRINCGGAAYKDENGNIWQADRGVSTSWTNDFSGMPAYFASQRRTFSPIKNTHDWPLFQSFRYGKNKLQFEFNLPDGEYLVELYFIEPCLGIGGTRDAKAMRLFDIAINEKTVLHELDIWAEAGTNAALKKTVKATISGGKMKIHFPASTVGQAVISAIAIASVNKQLKPIAAAQIINDLSCTNCKLTSWLDIGDLQYPDATIKFNTIPANLFGADRIMFSKNDQVDKVTFITTTETDIFISLKKETPLPAWLKQLEDTKSKIITDENGGQNYGVYRQRFSAGKSVSFAVDNNMMVILLPVSKIQPAFDLKPVVAYRTNVAIPVKGISKQQFATRECAVVTTNDTAILEWPVQIGVADIYAITLKYFYGKELPITATLQLIGAGNTMMMEQPVSIIFTRNGKWNQFTTQTGNMINAGNYRVRLIIKNAVDLAISGIELQ